MKILHRIGMALGLSAEPESDTTTLIIDDEVDSLPTTAGHISILPSPATVGHTDTAATATPSGPLVDALRALVAALEPDVRRAIMPEIPPTIASPAPEQPAHDDAEERRLRSQLEQARLSADRQRHALSDRINDLQNQVALLEEKNERMALAVARHPVEPEALERIKQLEASAKKLEAENQRLATLNQQLDTKSRISDKMVSDLQASAASARKEAQELHDKLEALAELEEKFKQVEALMARKNQRIEDLQKQLEENVYNQTYAENKLRRKIKGLEEELAAVTDPEAKGRGRRRRDPKPEAAEEADSQPSLF